MADVPENTMIDDQMEIEAMAMANKNSGKNGKSQQSNVIKYETDSIDLTSNLSTEASLRELKILQQHCVADYKEWANQEVKYTDLTDDAKAAASKMKKCNDSYTMSMLMQCISPLSEGLDANSIMASWMTYKMALMMNPSLKQDTSRLLTNFRGEIAPMLDTMSKEHPILGKLAGPISKSIDKNMEVPAGKLMTQELRKSEAEGTIDDLSMTPRQLAAIKLNFMEQFYVDSRSYDVTATRDREQINLLKEKYDTAMQHVANIAANGGYDMSVVAAEERYLVGLKAIENPNYLNMFTETSDVYAAKPKISDVGRWDGDFETADGHSWRLAKDEKSESSYLDGAFTVRMPVPSEDREKGLTSRADEFAAMIGFINSDLCPLSKAEKKAVTESINLRVSEYKESFIASLKDDGYKIGESNRHRNKSCEKYWEDHFSDRFNSQLATYLSKDKLPYLDEESGTVARDFYKEMSHIVDKHCIRELGLGKDAEGRDILGSDDFKNNPVIAKQLVEAAVKYNGANGEKEPRLVTDKDGEIDYIKSADNIYKDMRADFLSQMTPDEIEALMYHVGANMEQGQKDRGSFSRSKGKDEVTKATDEVVNAVTTPTPGDTASAKKDDAQSKKDRVKAAEEAVNVEEPDTDVEATDEAAPDAGV